MIATRRRRLSAWWISADRRALASAPSLFFDKYAYVPDCHLAAALFRTDILYGRRTYQPTVIPIFAQGERRRELCFNVRSHLSPLPVG